MSCKTWQTTRVFSIQGSRFFDNLIATVLTFEFGHNITILVIEIFYEVDYLKIEPALPYYDDPGKCDETLNLPQSPAAKNSMYTIHLNLKK